MNTLIDDIVRLDAAISPLRQHFASLTRAHLEFQKSPHLKSVSVSDVFDDGSIDATFHGVLVKFRLLYTMTVTGEPVGRVMLLHCYNVNGKPQQAQLGEFTVDVGGRTNIPGGDADGRSLVMPADVAQIVLIYMRKALHANASLIA